MHDPTGRKGFYYYTCTEQENTFPQNVRHPEEPDPECQTT